MNFNPFSYKNGADFLKQTGFSSEEAIMFLEKELKKLEKEGEGVDDKIRNHC